MTNHIRLRDLPNRVAALLELPAPEAADEDDARPCSGSSANGDDRP